jgi:hypothetical protein
VRNDPVSYDALLDREVMDEMIHREERDVAGDRLNAASSTRS